MVRTVAAGAAPYPGDQKIAEEVPAGTRINGITLNADGMLTTPDGGSHPTDEAFIGAVEGAVLNIVPGKYAHIHHDEDGSGTFFRFVGGRWFVAHVEGKPRPSIGRTKEPEQPTVRDDSTLIYNLVGRTMEVSAFNMTGHANGTFEMRGRFFNAWVKSDAVFCGYRIRTTGTGIVAITNEALHAVYKHARPNPLLRLLGHPKGWFQIKTAAGEVRHLNSWGERFIWSPWFKIILFLVCIAPPYLMGVFVGPILLFLIYSSGRSRLPRSFFDDKIEDFYPWANVVHKAVEAHHLTLGDLFEMYEGIHKQ